MGLLESGKWVNVWDDNKENKGRFIRKDSQFRNWVTPDGMPGATGEGGFKAEVGRYHLYVSLACPWAHRALIFRKIKGLEEIIPISVVHFLMGEKGWTFDSCKGAIPDTVNNTQYLHQLYTLSKKDYSGKVTVPVLWDKKNNAIVSNESSEIIRMLNSSFDELGALEGDYYPKEVREAIDKINNKIYHTINNGVYKAGFATSQNAYEEAVLPIFETLNELEDILSEQKFLVSEKPTEADWRLFTTLIRFDAVYYGHFKCNIKKISEYKNLSRYLMDLFRMPGISETVNFDHIKKHYYMSHETINPSRITPKGLNSEFF
jgi:putative glutathione S-transferase